MRRALQRCFSFRVSVGTLTLGFALALACFTQAVLGGQRSAETPECKQTIARIIQQTNTRFDHFSRSGGSAFFRSPDMVLICDPKFVTFISLTWNANGFPPNDWFALAAAAAGGAVTDADPKKLEAAAHQCHDAALKEANELADVRFWDAAVSCQAFVRSGGGVIVEIAKPRQN